MASSITYQYGLSRDIGLNLCNNHLIPYLLGFLISTALYKTIQFTVSNGEHLPLIYGLLAILLTAMVFGCTAGYYFYGLYYQRFVLDTFGPKTLLYVQEFIGNKKLGEFDIDKFAQTVNER